MTARENAGNFQPGYKKLYHSGELISRIKEAYRIFQKCEFCPHQCQVNRLADEQGRCGLGREIIISGQGPHHGEEAPLSGFRGSGTIFFSGCSLSCLYCQNYDISQLKRGRQVSTREIASIMLRLQQQGCHNINLVTPTHLIYQILAALYLACREGLNLPLVYNSSGYDSLIGLKLLDEVVDIYLPDFKYGSNKKAEKYSGIPDYFDRASQAVKTMHSQVGLLKTDKRGIARRGLLIRHLVLPENQAESEKIFKYIAEEIHPDSWVNIMQQYYPAYQAHNYPELSRRLSRREFSQTLQAARKAGLKPDN